LIESFGKKKPGAIEKERRKTEEEKKKKENQKEAAAEKEAKRQAKVALKRQDKMAAQEPKKEIELTPEAITKKLKEILAARGRRGTDRKQVIDDLRLLASKSRNPLTLLKVQITLVSALFETSLNRGTHMIVEHWKNALSELNSVITSLSENPQIRLSEDEEVEEKDDDEDTLEKTIGNFITSTSEEKKSSKGEEKKSSKEEKTADGDKVEYVIGNLYSFTHRLTAEYINSLRYIDHHSPEYLARLRDERILITLISRAQDYYTQINKPLFVSRVILRRMELSYYHYHRDIDIQRGLTGEEKKQQKSKNWDSVAIEELASYVYQHGSARDRTRALLFHVYHFAIHNRFTEARDLLLMSHVQDNINETDIKTRILFNRTIATLGLCAFRVGEYRQALNSLAEFYPSNRIRELLAQGVSRSYTDRNLEKEKEERRRQYPFHMHLNIEMIEAFHLLSAMFEEVPNLALYSTNRRRIISKTFRHHYNHYTRQAFNGPPENTRDGVMAATTALQEANWQKALKYIRELKIWDYVPNDKIVKELLTRKIQEVALRTYLLSYAPQYHSLDIPTLKEMFQLDDKLIHKVASEMILAEQLQGAWDQTSTVLLMSAEPPTRLQRAALAFTEKATLFVEQNERLMDQRSGFYRVGGERGGDRLDRGNWGSNIPTNTTDYTPRAPQTYDSSRNRRFYTPRNKY